MNRTPLLTQIRDTYPAPSLERTTLVARQHVFLQTQVMIQMLMERGLVPYDTHILGKCYSTHAPTIDDFLTDGVHVLQDESTEYDPHRPYDELISKHVRKLADATAVQTHTHDLVVALDSGGHLLQELNARNDIRKDVLVGIEQTSSGLHITNTNQLEFPVLNVARSVPKLEKEAPMIADTVVAKLLQRYMPQLPGDWQHFKMQLLSPHSILEAKRARRVRPSFSERMRKSKVLQVLIIGGGTIGRELHSRLLQIPKIFDVRRNLQVGSGWSLRSDLRKANIVIGCTGKTSVPQNLHRHFREHTVLASASSSDREFDACDLRQNFDPQTNCHTTSTVTVPSTGKRIHLLNQGFPINFTGGAEDVPLEKIQLTQALLMCAILDAHRFKGQKGLIDYPDRDIKPIKDFCALL